MPEIAPPYFDSLTMAAIAVEVRAVIGARFAGVHQLSTDAILLGLRHGHTVRHLLFSIHPRTARVHFAPGPEHKERLSPFGQLLRSRLVEAHLDGVDQPPFDRVLRLHIQALEGPLSLIAEIMGRYSNLILTDGRIVVGALKIVTEQMSPRRPVLPGRPYLPPPAERPRPDAVDEAEMRAILESERPLAHQVSGSLLGVSPLLAREIALRAGLDPEMPARTAVSAAGRIVRVMHEIGAAVRGEEFAPVLYEDRGRLIAFAPIRMRVYETMQALPVGSMSEAVDRFYRSWGDGGLLEERRQALASTVRTALRQREKALENNRRVLGESQSADRYRVMGELLLTYGSRARPGGSALAVPDHTAGGAEVTIPLEPGLTSTENAQLYFRRYAKARATARALPARIARLESEMMALRHALVQIEAAVAADDLWEIHADLAGVGVLRRAPRGRSPGRGGPRQYMTVDGETIVVGRSARENDHVTFHVAGPDDLWFHARGIPGAHVILRSGGTPSEASIAEAAQVAAYYSEGRYAVQVAVDCVARKHVRKARGAPPGAVVYEGERTLRASPALPPPGSLSPPGGTPPSRPAPRSRPRQFRRSR